MNWHGMDAHRIWYDAKLHAIYSKDSPMYKSKEAQMDKSTIAALHGSISHWNDICYGMSGDITTDACALCTKFYYRFGCDGCPIKEFTGETTCRGTSYGRYQSRSDDFDNFCTAASADAAEQMINLLVSLLPKEERSRYTAVFSEMVDEWRTTDCGLGLSYIWHNITPDARNAFPQAKGVWRRVLESQMPKAKFSTVMDPESWWIEVPPLIVNGNCVTCGQKVKKKVTKYKVVYRHETYPELGSTLEVSRGRYKSKADFDRQFATGNKYKFVSLIKETAKEFDE